MIPNLTDLQRCSVLVLGDLILDEYLEGSVQRISPEAPVPVFLETKRSHVLGGAGNVAANIASFGAKSILCGRVGADGAAREVSSLCREHGIQCLAIIDPKVPTTQKTRVMAGYQQMIRIDKETVSPLTDVQEQDVIDFCQKFLEEKGHKSVVISDYGKGFFSPELLDQLIGLARAKGVPTITDPKSADFKRYTGSTVLKPNRKEAEAALGKRLEQMPEVEKACAELCEKGGVESVVLSLSERGVVCHTSLQKVTSHFPSTVRQVADVSGAGDTMVAFLAMGLATGWDLSLSTRVANEASGIVCSKLGTATLSLSELELAVGQSPKSTEKIFETDALVRVLSSRQKSAVRVVFTNGCFDLLHVGHVTVLERAKTLGDFLVVGVNSDQSVKKLKGPDRPIQNQSDRSRILASLESVDAVVVFDEETPLKLIEALNPKVLVKGGDYEVSKIVGYEHVKKLGGEVVTIPFVEGKSTTSIVSLLRGS